MNDVQKENRMNRILIVEDDEGLARGIMMALSKEHYQFTWCASLDTARKHLSCNVFDLILLDMNLPDGNGLTLCQQIRQDSSVPIIFLTANDLEVDEVAGLEAGADDYIMKPFRLAILRARVDSVLRRSQREGHDRYETETFLFDFEQMVFTVHGEEITLSKTEQKLLKLLVSSRGQIVSRDILMERIWGEQLDFVDENALSVTVRRLRSKLEQNPSAPQYIQTVYGLGYTWTVRHD